MRGSWIAGAASLLILGATVDVAAQCAPGRAITDATAGRCCWPGQTWDDERARCDGPPACPSGWGAAGDECVRIEAPAASPARATASPAAGPPAASIPLAPSKGGYMRYRTIRRPIKGLWTTGTFMLALAYTYSIVIGSIYVTSSSCDAQNSWANWIPIVGGYIWAGVADGCGYGSSLGMYMGIPGSGVQTLGLIFLTIGLLTRQSVHVPDHAPRVTAGPGDLGLALSWDLD